MDGSVQTVFVHECVGKGKGQGGCGVIIVYNSLMWFLLILCLTLVLHGGIHLAIFHKSRQEKEHTELLTFKNRILLQVKVKGSCSVEDHRAKLFSSPTWFRGKEKERSRTEKGSDCALG